MRQVLIEGFKQDSLSIVQDYGSTVLLEKNQIRVLNAVVGKSSRSGSNLIIQEGNQFETTHLDIRNYSKLFLDNSIIHSFNYKLADGAKLIVSGKAQNLLNQSTTQ